MLETPYLLFAFSDFSREFCGVPTPVTLERWKQGFVKVLWEQNENERLCPLSMSMIHLHPWWLFRNVGPMLSDLTSFKRRQKCGFFFLARNLPTSKFYKGRVAKQIMTRLELARVPPVYIL